MSALTLTTALPPEAPEVLAPEWEIVRGDTLLGTAPSWRAAEVARQVLGSEMRLLPSHHLEILHPPEAVYPVLGGGTATAREIGLPLVEVAP